MYRDVAQERREQRTPARRVARVVGGTALVLLVIAALLALWMLQVFYVGIT